MIKNHFDLFRKVQLIYVIAAEAIKFFNKDLPEDERKNGVRICFAEQETGGDVLNIPVGVFSIGDSEKFFDSSREKAVFVSGENASFTTVESLGIPLGGVQGFTYSVGVAGQKLPEEDEAIAAAIVFIVEQAFSSKNVDYLLKPSMVEYYSELKILLDQPGRNEKFNELMIYLLHEQKILKQIEFLDLMK